MAKEFDDVFHMKGYSLHLRGIEVKDFGSIVVLVFHLLYTFEKPGNTVVLILRRCSKISIEFYGDEIDLKDGDIDIFDICFNEYKFKLYGSAIEIQIEAREAVIEYLDESKREN